MYPTTTNYAFTTCIRLRFHSALDEERAERVGVCVQAFLNTHAREITNLAGVTVRQPPSVAIDGCIGSLPLELHMDPDLPFNGKMRLAQDVLDDVRASVALPDIAEVLDDVAPPVATVGC